jgi:hypothetical protein
VPWTNRGKYLVLGYVFNPAVVVPPAHFYVALTKTGPVPTTNYLSGVTEADNGNGYVSGGIQLSKNASDFPTLTEDDTNNFASIQIRTLVWSASGGPLPATGTVAFVVLTDDNATLSLRQMIAYWPLSGGRSIAAGLNIQFLSLELDLV